MTDNQQQGQGSSASSGQSAQATQPSDPQSRQATPGGSNPSGGGQPRQPGGASQQAQSGHGDQQGDGGLDEEDITQSPPRDASLVPGSGDGGSAAAR